MNNLEILKIIDEMLDTMQETNEFQKDGSLMNDIGEAIGYVNNLIDALEKSEEYIDRFNALDIKDMWSFPDEHMKVDGGYLRIGNCDDRDGGFNYDVLDDNFNIISSGIIGCWHCDEELTDEENQANYKKFLSEDYKVSNIFDGIDSSIRCDCSYDKRKYDINIYEIIRACTKEEIDKIEEARD